MDGNHSHLDPTPILQTAFAFWSSKVLLTAVEFGVFTVLANRKLTGTELGSEFGLHPRGIDDFFDALVAMRFLDRDGDGPGARYSNTPATALFLDRNSPRYVGGILVMLNERLFKYWHDLPEALRTGTTSRRLCGPASRRMRPSTARRGYSRSSTPNCRSSNSSWGR